MLAYALTIFLSAFLLFEVQPVIGKYILPWFGGAPAVWTTCMLFFQVTLLGGYLYAHGAMRRLTPSAQRALHLSLLALSLLLLLLLTMVWGSPILPGSGWKPPGGASPVPRILLLLAASVGLPYFLLATTGPLLQAWVARAHRSARVYRLYALSNLGSLLAPLTYPFLVEPALALKTQAAAWSFGYVAFTVGCGFCAWQAGKGAASGGTVENTGQAACPEAPGRQPIGLWFALAACGSTMLLATTNQMCQEVASIPFLWLLLLALYLLSFILCFESERFYSRAVFGPLLAAAVGWAALVLYKGFSVPIRTQVLAYSAALFASCMVCHGELARAKPPPNRLTSFYLTVAAGGAAGGIFVGLAAPHLFNGFWEIHVALWLSGLLALVALVRDRRSWLYRGHSGPALVVLLAAGALLYRVHDPEVFSSLFAKLRSALGSGAKILFLVAAVEVLLLLFWMLRGILWGRGRPYFAGACLAGALGLLAFVLHADIQAFLSSAVSVSRNFYGVLTVEAIHSQDRELSRLNLRHGRIIHGFQYQSADKRRIPTTYYGEGSGIGLALLHHPRRAAGPLRVGVVGLGTGTIAEYGRKGDFFRFYDINPEVVRLSGSRMPLFTYLRDSPASIETVLGDARLSLERELALALPQNFDVLAVDAFSSDSIPIHLLTKEALAVYLAHLSRPDGILALHISNRHLDLAPVVRALAGALKLEASLIDTNGEGDAVWGSTWILLARDPRVLGTTEIEKASKKLSGRAVRLWTDDYSNLFQVLK